MEPEREIIEVEYSGDNHLSLEAPSIGSEDQMGIIQVEDSGDNDLSQEASHDSDVSLDDRPIAPSIGSEHQAEIPNLATEDERRHLMASPLYSCKLHVYDDTSSIGSDISIIWGSHPPSEVNMKEDITSECDLPYPDPHAVLSVDHTESASDPHQRETGKNASLPGLSASVWNELEEECFLLGLHIFGKNLVLLSKFVHSKTVGDMLSYYYGRFYNRDAYKRWSHCRKKKTTRCILGKSIFTGRRQLELISRLKSKLSKEAHDSVVEVLKSFSDDLTSLEECAFTLKSTIGPENFVEVVGIGKGKHDLTGFVKDTTKITKGLYGSANMAKGIKCSKLATEDIIKFLTGDFRRSKAKSNDLFWEAVWPRLLARGWYSEQPKDVRTAKNCLVFIVPGIKKFSREKLTKGIHYFDSTCDVLKKVATDPSLLELEFDGTDNGAAAHKNARTTSKDGPLNDDLEPLMFTVIDTSLVQGERPFKVRALRSLPADADICSGPAQYSDDMSSHSSSQEQDSDDNMSDNQEYHGRVTARVKSIGMESAYGTTSLVNLLQKMETAPQSAFRVNGHSSDDQHSDISNGNDDEVDVTCFAALGTKTGRRVYLSPKRRSFARRSKEQTSRRSFSFRNVDVSERNKLKPLSTSSKPTVVDLSGSFQTRTLANCSMKGKPCEEIADVVKSTTNGISLHVASINEDKSSEGKFYTVGGASMGTSPDHHNCQLKDEDAASSISNSKIVPDALEAAGKHDLTVLPRHGTRTRAPTAKALEAVALGLPAASLGFQTRTSANISMKGKPCEEIADVVKSTTNGISLNEANRNVDKSLEGKYHTVGGASMRTSPDSHNCQLKNEDAAPSISYSKIVPDALEAAGKHDLTVHPRHGTRTRAPTAKALEAVALGFQTRTLSNCSMKGKPCEQIADVVKSNTNGITLNEANIDVHKSLEGMFHTVGGASMGTSPDNHNCQLKIEDASPSSSNSKIVPDALDKHGLTVQPRHGTRTRAPTARALEAVALGLLGGAKRKCDPRSLATRRPPQRARKNMD